MTPWQRAEQWHLDHDATKSFAEIVGQHLATGYLFSSPQLFFLAREVHYDPATESFTSEQPPNCWFVHLAATSGTGNPAAQVLRHAPHPLPYVGWCRRNSFHPHVYSWDRLTTKTNRNK